MQPDRQVGARAAVAKSVEAARGQRLGALLKPRDVLVPRLDRVGLVEADGCRDRFPQALDVGLPEHRLGPACVRVRHDRPVAEPVGQLERRLGDLRHPGHADTRAVEVREQLGLGVAGDGAQRAADLAESVQALDQPGR